METLAAILPYVQVILAVLLVAGVLLQRSEAGLGEAFGGADSASFGHTRRGAEKTIFNATIAVAALFAVAAFAALVIASQV
jgi:preprotein translocase subunit SecG